MRPFTWLVLKDLVGEVRLWRTWPMMLLLGLVLVLLLEMQLELPSEQKQPIVSGLLWLDVFFAGTLALDRSFTAEREEGCWGGLRLYPVSPTVLFLAKVAVNFIALVLLECVLVPAFVVFSNVPLLERPGAVVGVALLANLGLASVGVLVSALTAGLAHRGGLLALVLLPLTAPVLLGAAEATRLAAGAELGEAWWRWVQLLAAFAGLFTVLGMLLFEFALED